MQSWLVQTAKACFSDVVKSPKRDGLEDITVHGKSVAVVLSRDLFDQLSGNSQSLVEPIQRSPLCGLDDLTFGRDQSPTRDIKL